MSKTIKRIRIGRLFFLVEVFLCILIILVHAINAGHYVNYRPINGTFQNFNPVRRFLAGQIPYRDFQDYLGMGHLYSGTLVTMLLGGTYRANLVAFSFLSLLSWGLISFIIAKVVLGKKEYAIALTTTMLVILLVKPLFYLNGLTITEDILSAMDYALSGGNSARFVRGMILPISCIAFRIGKGFIKHRFSGVGNAKYAILAGVIAGAAFVWSNDYGISCCLCIFIMTFWYSFSADRKILSALKYAVIELISTAGAIFVFAELLTMGHFMEWLNATFGTGGYQRWYYNTTGSFYIWDVDMSFWVMLQSALCVYYLIRMLTVNTNRIKYTVLAYMNMTAVCAIEEYKLLSGGNCFEVSYTILFFTIVCELLNLILKSANILNRYRPIALVLVLIPVAFLVSAVKDELVFYFLTDREGINIAELGGNATSHGEDLMMTDKFLDGDSVFATYASAQEVVSGNFQPSGTDYIIHVLGDKQREAYLKSFHDQKFRYAATIKEEYTDWEYWIQRANWYFYRELYDHWHPVFSNSYEVYWEKNTDETGLVKDGIELEVVDVSRTTKKLVIRTDESVNGIADVYIEGSSCKTDRKSSLFVIQKRIEVYNTGTVYAKSDDWFETNNLRGEVREYIPVTVVNGYGEVTLLSQPKRNTYLDLKDVRCDRIFTCTSDYLEVLNASSENEKNIITIANTPKNMNSITNASHIELQGVNYQITAIENDDSCIYVNVGSPVEFDRDTGNYMKIRRNW